MKAIERKKEEKLKKMPEVQHSVINLEKNSVNNAKIF